MEKKRLLDCVPKQLPWSDPNGTYLSWKIPVIASAARQSHDAGSGLKEIAASLRSSQ